MLKQKAKKTLSLNIDASLLSSEQVRLLNALYHSIYQTVIADDEKEFFVGSTESMKMCASLIKQANYGKKGDQIPHSQQALEYSLEILREYLDASNLITYDH